jgi:hypothetical protein
MENLPYEIIFIISDYLSFIDHYSLRLTCTTFSLLPQKNINEIIEEKLSLLCYNPKKLLKKIYDTRSIICGDFLLECIYDIDLKNRIEIIMEPYFTYKSVLNRYGYEESNYMCSSYKLEQYLNVNFLNNVTLYRLPHDYKYNDKLNYIRSKYYTDLQCVAFNGKNLIIYNLNDIIQRNFIIKPHIEISLSLNMSAHTIYSDTNTEYDKMQNIYNVSFHPKFYEMVSGILNYQNIDTDYKIATQLLLGDFDKICLEN